MVKGVCPVCGGEFTVKKDGTMWHHLHEQDPMSRWRRVCEGVGKPPVATM